MIPLSSEATSQIYSLSKHRQNDNQGLQAFPFRFTPYEYVRFILQTPQSITLVWQQTKSNIVHKILSLSLRHRIFSITRGDECPKTGLLVRNFINAYLQLNRDISLNEPWLPSQNSCWRSWQSIRRESEFWNFSIQSPRSISHSFEFAEKFIGWLSDTRKDLSLTFGALRRSVFFKMNERNREWINDFNQMAYKYSFENRNFEIVDVDVSIRYTIVRYIVSHSIWQIDSEMFPHSVFNEIKWMFLEIRGRRKFLLEAAAKGYVNYSLYKQDRYGRLKLIAEIRNRNFVDFTGTFARYLKITSDDEIERIGNSNIYDLMISPGWRKLPGKILRNPLPLDDGLLCPIDYVEDTISYFKLFSKYLAGVSIKFGPYEFRSFEPFYKLRRWKGVSVKLALDAHHIMEGKKQSRIYDHLYFAASNNLSRQNLEEISRTVESHSFVPLCLEELPTVSYGPQFVRRKVYSLYKFIQGNINLDDIGITEKNANQVLSLAKLIDLAFNKDSRICKMTTFEIRMQVLLVCKTALTTCEVFTNTFDPSKFNDPKFLGHKNHWVNERTWWHARITMHQHLLSKLLAHRIGPVILAVRGNTAMGKSYWIDKVIKDVIEKDEQLANGVINPDLIKAILKKITSKGLLNDQVRLEANIIYDKFMERLTKQVAGIPNAIFDSRLLAIEDLKNLLSVAEKRDSQLEIVDIEGPIWNSINAVLNRSLNGSAPRVTFEVIKDGYIRARRHRQEFIDRCRLGNVNYSLFYKNENSESFLVAKNRGNTFVCNEMILMECLRIPAKDEIDAIGKIEITEELIKTRVSRNPDPKKNKYIPKKWIGKSILEALEAHSLEMGSQDKASVIGIPLKAFDVI